MYLLEKIQKKQALIGVVGLGYVGLPLVREFASEKFFVLGFDIDPKKIEQLNQGKSYILSVKPKDIQNWHDSGQFEATTNLNRLNEPDVLIICVPTPLTKQKQPDLIYIENTATEIGRSLRKDQLVVLESTTYPGTTIEFVQPILEELSGLKRGKDFYLAFSPEREDPGNKNFTTRTIPKVVGADDPKSLQLVTALYQKAINQVIPVKTTKSAEATKLLENIFRTVNIALVNELKILFDLMGIDIWEVIEAAKTKPFGFMPFYPGAGVGGHCLSTDPFYLSSKAKEYNFVTKFIELAGEINNSMPRYVLNKTSHALNQIGKPLKDSQLLIIGVAYKPDIGDDREAPALEVIKLLKDEAANVSYYDPYIQILEGFRHYPELYLESEKSLTKELLEKQDCVLIITNHSEIDYQLIVDSANLIVDTKNVCEALSGKAKIIKG